MRTPRRVLKVVVEIMARRRVALMCLGLALCCIGSLRGEWFEYKIQWVYGM